MDALHEHMEEFDGFNLLPMLMKPLSRGTMRLKSSDPYEDPLIDPNFLSHSGDVKTLIEGNIMAWTF